MSLPYIRAAFRSSRENEAYLFMMHGQYLVVNYAPDTIDDKVVIGKGFICEGFPSLSDTPCGYCGIDCAFRSHHGNEAFVFYQCCCVQFSYVPGARKDKIIKGPMFIDGMFPFLNDTEFMYGVDAAFETSTTDQAYIFKSDEYALINYSIPKFIATGQIIEAFPCLKDTVFESGIDAAFASHRDNEAYIFKEDSCACLNFKDGKIIGGVKKIIENWPSLANIQDTLSKGGVP